MTSALHKTGGGRRRPLLNSTAPSAPSPIFTVTLRPEPRVAEPIVALRAALKRLLRDHGMRAIAVREERPEPETGEPESTDGEGSA